MKLTQKNVTKEALEALAVDGIIYLVQINTTKAGYHYISGFKSKEQAKMYRALLEGRNYEYGYFFANYMTVEEAYSNIYIEANTTFTPVTQYRISKNDNVKYTHPHLTSKALLMMADELLVPKQSTTQSTQEEEITELVLYNYQISIAETGKTLYRQASTEEELISSLVKDGVNEHHTWEINQLGIARKIPTVKESEGYKVLQTWYK